MNAPAASSLASRAGLLGLGMIVSVGLAEGVLCALDLPSDLEPPRKSAQFHFLEGPNADREIGYVNLRSAAIRFEYASDPRGSFDPGGLVTHHTNPLGFRGPAPPTDPQVLRIAFLGDSFTFGEGVRDADTFAEQTARRLAEALGAPVAGLNLGVGGHNAEQAAAIFEGVALPLEPDAVVLGYTLNDVRPPLFRWDEAERRYVRRPGPGPRARSAEGEWPLRMRSLGLIERAGRLRARREALLSSYRELYAESHPRWITTRAALERLGGRCQSAGIPCVAVVFPLLIELDDYPLAEEQDRIVSALGAVGFEVLDLRSLLSGESPESLWVHPSDRHPNERVHSRVAEALAPLLALRLGALR